MTVHIDRTRCIGCGACEDVCPDVFRLVNQKAVARARGPHPLTQTLIQAVQVCPVEAISIRR